MKTTYLIWKDLSCNGINPDWQEITGKEFLALVRSPDGKSRHFIKLPSTDIDGEDGAFVLETTKSDYLKWKREKNRSDYLRNNGKGVTVLSYHAMESADGDCYGEELLCDDGCDVEAECVALFSREEVRSAVAQLDKDEQKIVEYFFLSEEQGSERDFVKLTGIAKTTVHRRKIEVLEKLKKIFSDFADQKTF